MSSYSPDLALGRKQQLCCSDEEETGSERLRDWTRPHSKGDQAGTWNLGSAVRSVIVLPQRDCAGRHPRAMAEQPCHCSLPPGLVLPPPLLCLPVTPHQTQLEGEPQSAGCPKAGGVMGAMKPAVGHGRCLTRLGLSSHQWRGRILQRASAGQTQREDQGLRASSFIRSLSSDLEADLEVLGAGLLTPRAQRSGGDSDYTKTGQLCLSHVMEQRRVCDIFSRSRVTGWGGSSGPKVPVPPAHPRCSSVERPVCQG